MSDKAETTSGNDQSAPDAVIKTAEQGCTNPIKEDSESSDLYVVCKASDYLATRSKDMLIRRRSIGMAPRTRPIPRIGHSTDGGWRQDLSHSSLS
jgi:hypothetical protein